MRRLFKASVKENRRLIKNHYLLTLHPLTKIKKPKPGNFFMVSVDKGLDPLLKRPFSIHRRTGNNFQILYRAVGRGTNILSRKKTGDTLEVIGPLGNNFPIKRLQNNTVLVAGGLGIAPIFALAESLVTPLKKTLLFYGAKTGSELLCINELKSIGIDPIISTDNGSLGRKGLITDVLNEFLIHNPSLIRHYRLYACGPKSMLKSLSVLAKKYKLKGYMALEQQMACGIGTCLGCVVNTIDGYKRVCKEGPVFPIEEIVW